ncbi:MAG: tRNA lysidine(34) synthetase TilS [Ignavibacteriaceae bacterium]|nr:tRNA lysidine(34) synthetase TilS [Ignavibacteriaceae bacterium]
MSKTVEQKTLKFIDENNLIEKGDKVLVAFSGGADSVFLLNFLLKFKRRLGIELSAFHLNHKLRGKSAEEDEKFCADFCSKNKIEFHSVSIEIKSIARKKKISVEEAGREIRYAELLKTAEKCKAEKIATAHNASDNVETILLNFVKGTGTKGLIGIPVRRVNIIRPILCLSSDEIRKYLNANKISYKVDKSNLSNDYERNFLRNEIIPKLKQKLNPRVEEKITNTATVLKDVNSFIENQINKLTRNIARFDGKELEINVKKISKLDVGFRSILFKSVLEKNFRIDLDSENIKALVELANSQSGAKINLKEQVVAFKDRDLLIISKHSDKSSRRVNKKIKIGQKLEIEGKVISIEEINKKNVKFVNDKSIEFISGDSLENVFEIRKWKAGDKFQPIGMKGTKNISDYLSDEKVSSQGKKGNLVLTNSGKIVWVIGLRIDERFKVTPKTQRILKLTFNRV